GGGVPVIGAVQGANQIGVTPARLIAGSLAGVKKVGSDSGGEIREGRARSGWDGDWSHCLPNEAVVSFARCSMCRGTLSRWEDAFDASYRDTPRCQGKRSRGIVDCPGLLES